MSNPIDEMSEVEHAYWEGRAESVKELKALRAKLAEVEGERDAWKEQFEVSADPDGDYREYCSNIMYDLQLERDDARRWAAVWKRSAKMWRSVAVVAIDTTGLKNAAVKMYREVREDCD